MTSAVLESSLIQRLQAMRDYRVARGKRYPLWVMLLVTILGVMSGCQGYRALEDFGIRHYQELCERLGLSLSRLPSDSTLRRMFHGLDFAQLTAVFTEWTSEQSPVQAGDWLSLDGKSLKGTFSGGQDSFQNFVAVVSLYSHQQRLVIAQQGYDNKQQSEITVVQELLGQLDISGVTFTLDALHCQKKTVAQIVEQGNDYLIAVKGNQPTLMGQFETVLREQTPDSEDVEVDTSHGRQVTRTVKVFAAPPEVNQQWSNAQSLIVVRRQGQREGQAFDHHSFYLSSLSLSAVAAGLGVRGHRDIENGLHWVRDVVFAEDAAPFTHRAAALNWSLVRSLALNAFRANGYPSLTRALRLMGHNLSQLFSLLTMN